MKKEIQIPVDDVMLNGKLQLPDNARGFIIFSHGSGSSRFSPRNEFVANALKQTGFGTLLFDLLTSDEDQNVKQRFNIQLLTSRLVDVTKWITNQKEFEGLQFGYFGASTGAASALKAAAILGPDTIHAVVSRGGRPDMAAEMLESVKSPTLFLVGGLDTKVIELNQRAFDKMRCRKELTVIPGASHLFEEPGKLELVAEYANKWFTEHLYPYKLNLEHRILE